MIIEARPSLLGSMLIPREGRASRIARMDWIVFEYCFQSPFVWHDGMTELREFEIVPEMSNSLRALVV